MTSVFHSAARWRPVRQRTRAIQATVPATAKRKARPENSGVKPGASFATLAAGLAGTPVCSEIQ